MQVLGSWQLGKQLQMRGSGAIKHLMHQNYVPNVFWVKISSLSTNQVLIT